MSKNILLQGWEKMFCFKNGNLTNTCTKCEIRNSAGGDNIGKNLPDVDVYKDRIHILFKQKIVAKEFPNYFGYLQERLLDVNAETEVVIDLHNTKYINHFCISKILITIYKIRKNKKIKIIFPEDFKGNKMMRYLYNLGVLDFVFNVIEFECWAGQKRVENYSEKNSFDECYDYAIFPYTVFEEKIQTENSKKIEEIINNILSSVQTYYTTRNQVEKYRQIESRVHLYLFEVIDNIFSHAYKESNEKTVWFAVNIYNNYLPPYRVLVGTPEERKFENRITRLQREVPMSVYKDIHDRYFGGFNIFVDDIGKGIQGTYKAKSIENIYKDVYLNGSNKRKTINGLKLVADQIATNCDMLWAHDGRNWVSTSFVENNSIIRPDESETIHYSHPALKGLTYDIFVNLAKNSKEKKRTYEEFGYKISLTLQQLKECIYVNKDVEFEQNVFVDLLNIKNRNKSFQKELNVKAKRLFYRPRATQKNKMGLELDTRVISKLSDESFFDTLVVYDLNQTTLFQIRAVFENRDYARELIKYGIETIALLTEESWIFCMKVVKDIFVMRRPTAVNYALNCCSAN